MSVVTLAEAKMHLRVTGNEEDALIQMHVNAAERLATDRMGRRFYVDQAALDAARAAVPASLSSATTAYLAATDAAIALTSQVEIEAALRSAEHDYVSVQAAARMTRDGVVIDDDIRAAVLLIVGVLYADREGADVPRGAESLLQAKKVYG